MSDSAPPDPREADLRTVRRAAARSQPAMAFGAVLAILGLFYALFAARQFTAPNPADAFDRPIANLALVVEGCGAAVRQVQPKTEVERQLLAQLHDHVGTTARLLVLTVRVIVASLLIVAGLVGLAVGTSEWRLLRAFARLGVG